MILEELVNEHYDSLSANDREMLTHIFREKQSVRRMNSTQLAAFLHVSRTTLVRLMRKLGIDTYTEFKLLLERPEEEAAAGLFHMEDIVNDYHRIIDELKKHDYEGVCRAIHRADTIYLYGTGNEQKAIAEEFERIFLTLGKCCVDLYDLGEVAFARERFRDQDLFIAISLSGENCGAAEVVRAVQEIGVHTLSLTRWANNTLARMCQDSLYVGTKVVSPSSGRSYEMVAAFYILLDTLSVRYLEYLSAHKKEAADAD